MDISNIANKGNLDRTAERSEAKDKVVLIPHAPAVQDRATISSDSRETLAAVESLAERARRQGSERQAIVEAAQARLDSGELSLPEALAGAARRLLESDFLAG